MGKKKLKRKANAKAAKAIAKEDVEEFVRWMCEQAALFHFDLREGIGRILLRLLKFWGSEKQRSDSFLPFLSWMQSTGDSETKQMFKYKFIRECCQRVMTYNDGGMWRQAMIVFWTLHIFIEATSQPLKYGYNLANLVHAIESYENGRRSISRRDAMYSPLASAFYFSRTAVSLTQWLHIFLASLVTEQLDRQTYCLDECPICISINYESNGSKKEQTMYVNSSITLKGFLMVVLSNLDCRPKEFKIVHHNFTCNTKDILLLTCSGHKTLRHIGLRNLDVIHIIDANNTKTNSSVERHKELAGQSKDVPKSAGRKTKKKGKQHSKDAPGSTRQISNQISGGAPSKPGSRNTSKQSNRNRADYSSNINQDKVYHSSLLTLVFEEASVQFQERRRRLNDLTIKCQPKKKASNSKQKTSEPTLDDHCCCPGTGSKAGKTVFPVLIGHEESLYKSSRSTKLAQIRPRSIDLHGCTRDEAIRKLNSSLPDWINEAMNELPWTLPVNIIVGGGGQILAETVQHWIRENRHVANRFAATSP